MKKMFKNNVFRKICKQIISYKTLVIKENKIKMRSKRYKIISSKCKYVIQNVNNRPNSKFHQY